MNRTGKKGRGPSSRALPVRWLVWLGLMLLLAGVSYGTRVKDLDWGGSYGWNGTAGPMLSQEVALGQAIELERPFLSHISMFFGTMGRKAAGEVEVRLLRGADPPIDQTQLKKRTLASTVIQASILKDSEQWRWELGDLSVPDRHCYLLAKRLDAFDSALTLWLDQAREFPGPHADVLHQNGEGWKASQASGHVSLALGYDRQPRLLTYLMVLTTYGIWLTVILAAVSFYLIVLFDWPNHGANLALAVGSVLLTLLVLEAGLRVVNGKLFEFDNFLYKDIDLFHSAYPAQFDEYLGFIPKVGYSSQGEENLWHKRLHILEQGIRSNGPGSKGLPARPLVLCVGDSFTFGAQVHDEESWPACLEQTLGVKTVNAGVFGFGLDQTVMRAEQLIPQYRPDLLIVGLIQDDILRNRLKMRTGVYKPYFTVKDGKLVLHRVPKEKPPNSISLERRIGGYSLLVHTIMLRVDKAYWLHGLDKFNYMKRVETAQDRDVEVSCLLFDRLAGLRKEYGCEVLVLFQYVKNEHKNRFARIKPCVERAGLVLVDLEQTLDRISREDKEKYESLFDSHMTAPGNRLVAEVLIERINETGLLKKAE